MKVVSSAVPPRFAVLGVEVDAVTMDDAIAALDRFVMERNKGYFVFCTVSTVLSARDDPRVARAIDEAALVTPDGMPLVWIGRRVSKRPVERVYGPDFLRAVFERGPAVRHFFYGGAPGVAEQVAANLTREYPKSEIAGWFSPPMDLEIDELDDESAAAIAAAGPDVVWVGLGHPKQELWMNAVAERLEVPVLAGVGAAFDFISGSKKEAPAWMKRLGLQWLHRLAAEPRRLWRRYILGNARFVWLLMRERARR